MSVGDKLVLLAAVSVPIGIAWAGLPRLAEMHFISTDSGIVQVLSPRPPGAQLRQTPTAVPTLSSPSTPAPSNLDAAPPPTLEPPARPTLEPTPVPAEATPQGRATIYNTGGLGAVLRAEPATGRQVAALREGQAVDILERTKVGAAEWVRVRVQPGLEGWVIGLVLTTGPVPPARAIPAAPARPPAATPAPSPAALETE